MSDRSLRVLAYHRIVESLDSPGVNPSLVSATAVDFERQMLHLARFYRVVSIGDVLHSLREGAPLPPRAVLITFDDGYRDFEALAWPILRALELPVTLFVPTAHATDPERVFWWDRLHASIEGTTKDRVEIPGIGEIDLSTPPHRRTARVTLQERIKRTPHAVAMEMVGSICDVLDAGPVAASEVLGWDRLRALASEGVVVAAHTRSHAAMPQLEDGALLDEVRGSLDDVRREIGSVPPVFCYPFGLHDDRSVGVLRALGVEAAFTCLPGHNRIPASEALRMRRTVITTRTSPLVFGLRLTRPVAVFDTLRLRRVGAPDARSGQANRTTRVAVIMSRFPKLSETFVLNEMIEMERQGVEVEVFPLLRERQEVRHREVEDWVRRARFQPFISPAILGAQLRFIRLHPRRYFRVLAEVLRETAGSANFFIGAIGIFPKSVRFALEMQELGVTHVHAHFATHPAVAALIIHRLTGIPFSFTAHGSDLHVERRMLATKLTAARFGVTVSEFNRRVMIAECGDVAEEKVHVIHCGVDSRFFAPVAEPPPGPEVVLVCVASLEEVKGHRFLIAACARLMERGIAFRCDLIGDGPLRSALELQIAEAGLADRVVIHGGRTRDEVREILTRADIAVLASFPTREGKREGIPVALMEAMSCGLPVVASDLSGIPELVEHGVTGLLVPPGDAAALEAALARLSGNPRLRSRFGGAGRERVLRAFDLEHTTRQLLALIGDGAPEGGEVAASGALARRPTARPLPVAIPERV
jgi:colanic acid/amylovoran biosynthesis glycosyltransferase